MYLTLSQPRTRRRRPLGSVDVFPGLVASALAPTAPTAPGGVSTPGLLWNWVTSGFGLANGCYPWDITCANRPAMIAAGQAQIQNVADNAAFYYGAGSPTAQVAQQVADQQKNLVPQDVATLTADNLSVGPGSIPWWFWAMLAAGVYVVVKR